MMKAVQLDPKKKTLSLIKTDIPTVVRSDDVIIKVVYAGICGTDLHVVDGSFPCEEKPFTLGHELCGVVASLGSEVKHVKPGDRVSVDPNKGCSTCSFCTGGRYHLCPRGSINKLLGIFSDGGWAQFCKVPASQVYRLPDTITFQQAVLTEPLSCVYYGLTKLSPVPVGSSILITGAGIIGNLWSAVLHHVGHRNVIVAEPIAVRRALNEKLGTGFKCCTPEELKAIKEVDPHWGVDLCVDCSGNGQAIQSSVELMRPGGKLAIFGVAAPQTRVSISPYDFFHKELSVVGILTNHFSFSQALGLIEAMGSRYLNFEKLGIKVFPLNGYQDALLELRKGSISKAVFELTSDFN